MRLETDRLVIREWTDADLEAYARFVGDPEVRRYFPETLTRQESDEAIGRYIQSYQRHGFGFLAVTRRSDGALLGHVGIAPVEFPVRGEPPAEIGWLLGRQYWGQGYAPEAARAWIDHAFGPLGLPEIVAWTSRPNQPSQRVMQKLGMTRDLAGDFDHPQFPQGHALQPHLLYRIANPTARA